MRNAPKILALFFALLFAPSLAAPLAAGGPDLVASPYDVKVANGIVEVNFALAMSEVPNYPVTITAINGPTEEVLYEGTLSAGVYRFSAPLKKISGRGELKVVLRTRITNRSERGNESYTVYLKWQGSL